MRGLFVVIDDREEVTLMHGDSMRVELPVGDHSVKVSNRLFSKRLEFHLADGEWAHFSASNTLLRGLVGLLSAGLVIIAGTGPYRVTLERDL